MPDAFEVPEPILNSPFDEPAEHWHMVEGETPERRPGHPSVDAFVKNAGLGFAVPYFHNGQMHDYIPDFIIRLKSQKLRHLILETKGYDELEEVKKAAAERWVNAVNAEGSFGQWFYRIARKPSEVARKIDEANRSATGVERC